MCFPGGVRLVFRLVNCNSSDTESQVPRPTSKVNVRTNRPSSVFWARHECTWPRLSLSAATGPLFRVWTWCGCPIQRSTAALCNHWLLVSCLLSDRTAEPFGGSDFMTNEKQSNIIRTICDTICEPTEIKWGKNRSAWDLASKFKGRNTKTQKLSSHLSSPTR